MSELNKDHIKIIRQYFLSHNDELKRNIRNAIPSILLKSFLFLEDGIISNTNIEIVASQIGASHLLPEIKQLQFDYYSSLAKIHTDGKINVEITKLLNNDNKLFKDILSYYQNERFEKEIKQAFTLFERANIKEKLINLKLEEQAELDIKNTITLNERKKWKEKLKEIDKQAKVIVMEREESYQDDAASKKVAAIAASAPISIKIIKNPNPWFKYAAAACVLGIISVIVYQSYNTRGGDDRILSNNIKDTVFEPMISLAMNKKTYNIKVLKDNQLGFASKEEVIAIDVVDLKQNIDTLKIQYRNEIENRSTSGYGLQLNALLQKEDSLMALNNQYTFNNNLVSIYALQPLKPIVYKINANFYIKIKSGLYCSIIKTTLNKNLVPVTDSIIIEQLKRIDFDNDK